MELMAILVKMAEPQLANTALAIVFVNVASQETTANNHCPVMLDSMENLARMEDHPLELSLLLTVVALVQLVIKVQTVRSDPHVPMDTMTNHASMVDSLLE